jgi:hypothetical protein
MRILHSPNISASSGDETISRRSAENAPPNADLLQEKIRQLEERLHAMVQAPSQSLPAPHPSSPDLGPLMEKISRLEERIRSLEQAQTPQAAVASPPSPKIPQISIDPETFTKKLESKMWKYLHDERSAKAI